MAMPSAEPVIGAIETEKDGLVSTVQPISSLAEAKGPEDNWTGLKNAVERRRLQNRLNVRAHRRRKAERLAAQNSDNDPNCQRIRAYGEWEILVPHTSTNPCRFQHILPCQLPCFSKEPHLLFPLSQDHRLISLVQYNVLRGIATNMNILSVRHIMDSECGDMLDSFVLFPPPETIPETLQPTALQRSTVHDQWIDLIPCPKMRDNVIRLTGKFDNVAFCADILGLYKGVKNPGTENKGMLVWADPWDPSGWELTDGFVRTWWMLIEGCQELIDSTNSWRAARNEEPLVIEL